MERTMLWNNGTPVTISLTDKLCGKIIPAQSGNPNMVERNIVIILFLLIVCLRFDVSRSLQQFVGFVETLVIGYIVFAQACLHKLL